MIKPQKNIIDAFWSFQGPGPFVVVFHTDDLSSMSNIMTGQANSIAQNELGFSLDFKVGTSCTILPLDKDS